MTYNTLTRGQYITTVLKSVKGIKDFSHPSFLIVVVEAMNSYYNQTDYKHELFTLEELNKYLSLL
jgi:hypothetical protein